MRDAKLTRNRLTLGRLRWLRAQDPLVSFFWLALNDWCIPRDPDRLFLFRAITRKIELDKYPQNSAELLQALP